MVGHLQSSGEAITELNDDLINKPGKMAILLFVVLLMLCLILPNIHEMYSCGSTMATPFSFDPESGSSLVLSESLPIPFEHQDQWPVFDHTEPMHPAT